MPLIHSHKAAQPHTHRCIPPYIFCGTHCCGDRTTLTLQPPQQPSWDRQQPPPLPQQSCGSAGCVCNCKTVAETQQENVPYNCRKTRSTSPPPPGSVLLQPALRAEPTAKHSKTFPSLPRASLAGVKAGGHGAWGRASQQATKGCGGTMLTHGLGELSSALGQLAQGGLAAAHSPLTGGWLGLARSAMLKKNTSTFSAPQNGRALHDLWQIITYFWLYSPNTVQKCNSAKSSGSLPKVGTI